MFVTQLDSTGTGLLFSTFLGGSLSEQARDIAIDLSGNIYITGHTGSFDFYTANALQATALGDVTGKFNGADGFVAKITPGGAGVGNADLAVTASSTPESVVLGSTLSYDVTVTNNSTTAANNRVWRCS